MIASNELISRVLVVDDDHSLIALLTLVLSQEGYEVAEAFDGEECLIKYSSFQPDIILIDAIMPEMDGFTCCERLRSLPDAQNIPILMITFLDDQESIDKAFEVGASDYITKPINWQVLKQRINRLINYYQLIREKNFLQAQLSQAKKWEKFLANFLQEYSQYLSNKTEFLNILKMSREYFKTDRVIYIQTGDSLKVWESVREGSQVLDRFDLLTDILKKYQDTFVIITEDIDKNSDEKISALLDYIDAKSLMILPVKLKQLKSYFIFINKNTKKWKRWEINQINNLGIILSF